MKRKRYKNYLLTQSVAEWQRQGHSIQKVPADPVPSSHIPSHTECQQFYLSKEWIALRRNFKRKTADELLEQGTKDHCAHCGIELISILKNQRVPRGLGRMNIDHIWPIKYYWDLRLDRNNLQYLCSDCNSRKSNNHPRTGHSFK